MTQEKNAMKVVGSLTLALVFAVSVTGCAGSGGDDTTTTASPGTTQPTQQTTQATEAPSGSADLTIAAFAFSGPSSVPVGTTVTVTNEDAISHTWTSDDGLFTSGSLSQGETFEFTFTDAGEYEFHCGIHPEMTGSITVEG
jgi:plastocyanin